MGARTILGLGTVTVRLASDPRPPDPHEYGMNGTRLHLATANYRSRTPRLTTPASPLSPLIHVQLTRLRRAPAACGTATTPAGGSLHASPHPIHSTIYARLNAIHERDTSPPRLMHRNTTNRSKLTGCLPPGASRKHSVVLGRYGKDTVVGNRQIPISNYIRTRE